LIESSFCISSNTPLVWSSTSLGGKYVQILRSQIIDLPGHKPNPFAKVNLGWKNGGKQVFQAAGPLLEGREIIPFKFQPTRQ
jgi:hypothetical protein